MTIRLLLLIVLSVAGSGASAWQKGGGLRGTVEAEDGNALVYATIYVKQTETGVASDFDGKYEVALKPGTYDVLSISIWATNRW